MALPARSFRPRIASSHSRSSSLSFPSLLTRISSRSLFLSLFLFPIAFRSRRCALTHHIFAYPRIAPLPPATFFSLSSSSLCHGLILLSLSHSPFLSLFRTKRKRTLESASSRSHFPVSHSYLSLTFALRTWIIFSPLLLLPPAIHSASSFFSFPISHIDPFCLRSHSYSSYLFRSVFLEYILNIQGAHPSYKHHVTSDFPRLHPIHGL